MSGSTICIAVNALTQAMTINPPTGAIVDMQNLVFRIRDNGVARPLVWECVLVFGRLRRVADDDATPTRVLHVAFRYSVPYARFRMVALTQEP